MIFLVFLFATLTTYANNTYNLLGSDGKIYSSPTAGIIGGHKRIKIYGRLDCANALMWISKGYYTQQRVFFASEGDALQAGYNPCNHCMGGDVPFRHSALGDEFVMRLAHSEDSKPIRSLLNKFRTVFPFIQLSVIESSMEREELLIVIPRESPEIVAGLARWYQRLDGWSTVHEIAVHPNFQRLQIASELIDRVPGPRWLKCLTEMKSAMRFYKDLGMRKVRTEITPSGRELTVWADPSELQVP